jgi:hypothetical protein
MPLSITPEDGNLTIGHSDVGELSRRARLLSSTTGDYEGVGDDEAFLEDHAIIVPAIPTSIEWKGAGEKVYVSGTFVQWDRKLQLHRDKKGGFATTLQLTPGMYQLKFLVDGDMTTSNDLPTTVDYTNVLVNYIEIVAPLPAEADKQSLALIVPMPMSGAAMTRSKACKESDPAVRPTDKWVETRPPEIEAEIPTPKEAKPAPETSKPLPPPPTQTSRPPPPTRQQQSQQLQEPEQQELPRQALARRAYTKQIPRFLVDLDRYCNLEDAPHQHSSRVVSMLLQPYSLPTLLEKSVLDGIAPHMDDASVLVTPNHTVLNHLVPSRIKDSVLATSCTTRYKRKVCMLKIRNIHLTQDR